MTLFWRIISWLATFGVFIAGIFAGTNNMDFTANYKKAVKSVDFYENDFDSAVPQTEIYNMINDFVSADSGEKEKKVIVIGYDGCRADNLTLCKSAEESGIKAILADGGHCVLSYCGGVNYPRINTQATSTAPGWCSMLTGAWADVHGVTDNGIPKSNDHLTLLTTLIENKKIDSSAFYVSWGGHFNGEDSTYYPERMYIEEKGLPASFVCANGDEGTYANVMADLGKADCSDFIFSIFEHCDHIGHDTGFYFGNEDQVKAFDEMDTTAKEVIDAVKARENYANEDWLIILTSDHGGYNSWHGGPTMQERYTFIACNKEITVK